MRRTCLTIDVYSRNGQACQTTSLPIA